MGKSIDPMGVGQRKRSRERSRPPLPALIVSLSLRPGISWRVALQHCPPPLPRLAPCLATRWWSTKPPPQPGWGIFNRRKRDFSSGLDTETLRPLNEAKLLVVGEEAVGKTSLINYLIRGLPRNPDETKTPGIAIEKEPWPVNASGLTANVWDFGGQVIMHGTHQFFLTRRSLYLLVLEARREDDEKVYKWLKTISNRGADSPVIVVINKWDDDSKQGPVIDWEDLKRRYPVIVDVVWTCCDDDERGRGTIDNLRELIAGTLATDARLKEIRDPYPLSWLRVKETIAAMAQDERVLKTSRFEELCKHPAEEGIDAITDPHELRSLLGILHDLGVVVAHGLERDAPAASREITLLDPNWLTGAIYTLLNSPVIRDQDGEFTREQVGELLDSELYPADQHEFILSTMQEEDVGLCFRIHGSDDECYLIPEALPKSGPDFGDVWEGRIASLRFRYQYEFLPQSLVPSFIVRAHRNLTATRTRWLSGVVLGVADCKVHLQADGEKSRMEIAVTGPEGLRRSALHVALNDLDRVHEKNPAVEAKAMVPLPDNPDVAVSYEYLRELEDEEGAGYSFRPEGGKRRYTIRELLESVRRDEVRVGGKGGGSVTNINVTIGDNVVFHGDFGVGKTISDSFNKAGASTAPDEVKEVLQRLSEEVAKVAEGLSAEDGQNLADSLKTLTSEATKENPRKEWWELSSKGILEAAATVGSVGATAIGLVEKLQGLLVG